MTAEEILALMLDDATWRAAGEIGRWQNETGDVVSQEQVLGVAAYFGCHPDVLLALSLGVIRRARLDADGAVTARGAGYACVHDEPTVFRPNERQVGVALALWLLPCANYAGALRTDCLGKLVEGESVVVYLSVRFSHVNQSADLGTCQPQDVLVQQSG